MNKDIISFVKASISSLLSAIVDLGMFYLICHNSSQLIIISLATIVSRCTSATVNFVINKYWAFKSNKKDKKEMVLFFILFISKILLSSLFVWLLRFIKIHQTIIKCIVDFILFFGSYIIQKKYIFIK